MATRWEKLERDCFQHLKKTYQHICSVIPFGKSNSTKPDIQIITSSGKDFFVEVKAKSSQCCQFVLFPNPEKECFDFSVDNRIPFFDSHKTIIQHMDENYIKYHTVGETGIPIDVDKSVLYQLVYDYFKYKKVKYFMTENNIIFPLEDFSNYFDIAAFYRKKTSGSSEPAITKNTTELTDGIKANSISGTIEYKKIDKKRRCFLHSDLYVHTKRIILEEYTYQFKDNDYSKTIPRLMKYAFEIRRLSHTRNPNVICQLTLKNNEQNETHLKTFENELNN